MAKRLKGSLFALVSIGLSGTYDFVCAAIIQRGAERYQVFNFCTSIKEISDTDFLSREWTKPTVGILVKLFPKTQTQAVVTIYLLTLFAQYLVES